ncbi:MAG: threonine synthase [Anaerolineae bacterium]|nr:threonine synthase [Anaerolineae bacterium]
MEDPVKRGAEHCWFECVRGCAGRYSIFDILYHCPTCGGLLEVRHDTDVLARRSADEWKRLFDQRTRTNEWPYGSGVWGKKEWICPDLDDENVVSMYEGHTNLFWAQRLGQQLGIEDLWVKLCGNSHTGSFKDLGMTVLVSVVKQIIANGTPVQAAACASTGDTSAALAAYCAAAGIPSIVFLPRKKVSAAQLIQPIANGALVLALDTDFDGCMSIVKKVTEDNSIYLANSMNSLRVEGQKSTGIEIVQQFDWEVPDWIVIPVGNLGNISALGKGLLLMKTLGLIDRLPRLAAAQAENANPFYLSYLTGFQTFRPVTAKRTLASAIQIGNPVSYEKAVKIMRQFEGVVDQVSEDELADASARADLTGMYCCPHTGVALAMLFKMIDAGLVRSDDRVVVISTAHGLKFTDFKTQYHMSSLEGVEARRRNPPVELPPDIGVVKEAIQRELASRAHALA